MKKLLTIFTLLCISVVGWGEPYCEKVVTTTVDYTSLDVAVTVKKQNATTVRVILDNEHITGIRAGGTFQQWGNGVWANQADAVANFAQGWTQDGTAWYKDFVFTTYPTTGNFQIYILMDHNAGNPAVAGFTLGSIDIDNACSGGGSTPEPEPTPATFTINTVWPDTRVSATKNGDDINVAIASYGGGQWQAQLKLEHNLSFDAKKAYKVAYSLTANRDCGGITFKTDDNNGAVYENQSIDLTANTPYNYEKVFSGQAGNNKITVFDFGWVGENTNITISDLTLVEYSPATASSINGDLIPFKAVDGNTETRWQAASTGEQWWKMDYGTAQSFNRVNITWEASYAKSFTIQGSNNDENYTTLATISGQTISTFPYKQVIDLDQIYNYRYVKFVGTENGNGYGFSFYEFEIMEVETSVLTDVVITSPKRKTVCAVGQSLDITAVARDQYEMPMDGQTISYSVSPAARGTIDANGHYTASQVGEVTITATCSNKSATIAVVNTVSGNLALNKTATAGDNETPIGNANDNNWGSFWSLGPNKTSDKWWWQVDLEETYDLSLVIIKWEGACPTEHAIQVSTDGTNWTDAATKSGWPEIGGENDHNYQFYDVNATARYIRVKATALREVAWGMKIYDFQAFGTVAASPTKSVSASVNDEAMGTATVKQNNADVTEVETGSTVTFIAVANEGYIFVNWSNGETNATFNAEVNSTMNLTANFRAIKTVYCMTEMEKNGHTIYVTMKRSAADTYQLVVRANEELQGFGNAYFYRPNNIQVGNISQMQELSDNNHTLTATMTAATEPYMTTPLYVIIRGVGEVAFDQLTDIEYAAECDDNASVTSVTISRTTASVAVGDEFDLTVQVVPAFATNKNITWSSDNTSVATVTSAGHVATLAEGTARITATSVDGGYTATCTVTVNAELETQTYWGNGSNSGIAIAYSITRNSDYTLTYVLDVLHQKTGFVPEVNYPDENAYHNMTYDNESQTYSHTTTLTYSDGDVINGFFWLKYEGGVVRIDFTYTVGSSSERQAYIPIEFDDNAEDASWINENDGKTRDVEIDRTLLANGYYKTICFPFSMDAEQIEATFGNCEILMLSGGHMKSETDIYVQYVPVHEIIAGKPYLMTNESEVAGLDFSGVLINSSTANNEIEVDLGGGKKITMIGTFVKKSLTDDDLYYLDIDGFLHSVSAYGSENSGAAVTIAAFRCYYQFEGFNNPAGVRARVVRVTDVVTGCEDLTEPTVATKQLRNGQLLIFRDGKSYTVTGLRIE